MTEDMPQPPGGAHLRTVAMPRNANASGDIFGRWTLSQMDLAGANLAAGHSGKRVVTVWIEAVEFLMPVSVGEDVSLFCRLEREGNTSVTVVIEVWARGRTDGTAQKATEGVFTDVAVGEDGRPVPLTDRDTHA